MELLRIREAAILLNVSIQTLRRWDKYGTLKPIRMGANGHRMYKKEDLLKFIEGQREI